jgi:hypothetical protein
LYSRVASAFEIAIGDAGRDGRSIIVGELTKPVAAAEDGFTH